MNFVKKTLALALALVLALSLTACSSSPFKNPVASLGETSVPSEDFYYYYASMVTSFVQQRNLPFDSFKDETMEEGSGTYEEEIVNYALDLASTQAVINTLFDQRGLKLTEEDEADIEAEINQYISLYGGELAFAAAVEQAGMSLDYFRENLRAYRRIDLLNESLAAEGAATDEAIWEAAQESFIRVKHILIKTSDDSGATLDEAGITAAMNQANDLVARLDAGEDFDALMKEYGQDPGMVATPDGYVIDQNVAFDTAFLATSFTLDVDEYELVLGSHGYHIIKRFPLRQQDLEATYYGYTGTADTVGNTIATTLTEDQLIAAIEAYKEENELVIDEDVLASLKQHYAKENPFTPAEESGEEAAE
ncbi:MAG: peptidylprolyl isomerase [Clostridia bacterium]|nr:peptidylprolyl isomerase [Clostridia bacterium]MBQ3077476.1 peptidylprolyl isomerase [Clostridia bacterium]